MTPVKTSTLTALQSAILIEDQGLEIYLKFARNTHDEFGKNMFIQLALYENSHCRILEKEKVKKTEGKKGPISEFPQNILAKIIPEISDKTRRRAGESGVGQIDALKTALEMERKTEDYFLKQAASVDDKSVKKIFTQLAEWENVHYQILQAELDAITETGFWFNLPEFRMDGKF